MHVVALQQPDLIRSFLRQDRFFADYALGDLDPAHFQFTEWFGAEEGGELCAVVMLYNDLTPPILFATGAGHGLEAVLDQAVQLPLLALSLREEHLTVLVKFYHVEPVPMFKMALLPEDFRPVNWPAMRGGHRTTKHSPADQNEISSRSMFTITRLDVAHLSLLKDLYAYGGGDAFRKRSLEEGVFYGVFDDSRLVSVAGTHIVSERERIAALGNVMTHPDYRGQGLATAATGAVCQKLLERGIELIGLSVSRSNEAALRVYESIGFKRRVPFFEGTASRIEIKDQELRINHRSQDDC